MFEIEVWPDNDAAIALYRAHGFEQIGLLGEARTRRDGSRSDVLLMRRAANAFGPERERHCLAGEESC